LQYQQGAGGEAHMLMSLSPLNIFLSTLFSAVGLFYLALGKRRQRGDMRLCGLSLLVYPFLVSNIVWLVVIGLLLSLLPPVIHRYY
jgi:hypothetical protein